MTSKNIIDTTGGTSDVSVSSCSNGIISAARSVLRIHDSNNFKVGGSDHPLVSLTSSSNINVEGTAGKVQVTSSSNGIISLKNSVLEVLKSSNFNVAGDSHWLLWLRNCSNTKITGTGGDVHLDSTSNVTISGDKNSVKAENVSNLVVKGDGNRVCLKDVWNHLLQPSRLPNTNVYEVLRDRKGERSGIFGRLGGLFKGEGHSEGSQRFNVDYVGEAKISGGKYELGKCGFNVESYPAFVEVRVDCLEDMKVTGIEGGSALELEGRGDGGIGGGQKLVLKGSKVVATGKNVFRVFPKAD